MNKTEIEEIKNIFDSIICFCVEGVEFMGRTELALKISEEAAKGYKLCQNAVLTSAIYSDGKGIEK